MYQHQEYIPARPSSGFRRSEGVDYDSYARVPDSRRTKPPPRPMSRRNMEGPTLNQTDSDEYFLSSSPDGPLVSPKSPTIDSSRQHFSQNKRINNSSHSIAQSHSPTSSARRPPSASTRQRSARLTKEKDVSQAYQCDSQDSLPSMSAIRPPSSFSKYRPLPAIGTPTPSEHDDFNDLSDESRPANISFQTHNQQQNTSIKQRLSHNTKKIENSRGRISSAVSDISVISTKANSSRRTNEYSAPSELVERLDLTQLENPTENTRRRKPSNSQSPSHKPKSVVSSRSRFDAGDLYDGDDDDSDTNNIDCVNTFVQEKKEMVHALSRSSAVPKGPVVIPSQNQLASANNFEQEILLAVRLPTTGTRHQRYFQRSETLMSIVQFAEEQAGEDFAGYILVSSGLKSLYEDLSSTIEEAGLEDRSVLHLEETD